jgi:hypothetical protein
MHSSALTKKKSTLASAATNSRPSAAASSIAAASSSASISGLTKEKLSSRGRGSWMTHIATTTTNTKAASKLGALSSTPVPLDFDGDCISIRSTSTANSDYSYMGIETRSDSPTIRIEMKKKSSLTNLRDIENDNINTNINGGKAYQKRHPNNLLVKKSTVVENVLNNNNNNNNNNSSKNKMENPKAARVIKQPLQPTRSLTLADLPDEERTKVTRLVERLVSLGRENEDLLSEISSLRARHASELEDANNTATATTIHWEARVSTLLVSLGQNEEKRSVLLGLIKAYQTRLQASIEMIEKLSKGSSSVEEKVAKQERTISSLEIEVQRLENLIESQKSLYFNF